MILKKLQQKHVWERLFYERLTEPLHLNFISLLVSLFGSYAAKVKYDLVLRPNNAFGILKAANAAKKQGIKTVTLIEFGVATGSGLMNMAGIARRVTKETGVNFKIYGFDTGKGMPPARDYRDHPDLYFQGDFEMDFKRLSQQLPANTRLVIGELEQTVPDFVKHLSPDEPIGYVALDVDYYFSSVQALQLLAGDPRLYLPVTVLYLDDIWCERHNSACGERLAVAEFNTAHPLRLIEQHPFFETTRVFRRAKWLKQMFYLHVLDHPDRATVRKAEQKAVLQNVFLK